MSQERSEGSTDYLLVVKHQNFPQGDTIVFGGHSQAWPNIFAIFQERSLDEVDFLYADKHQTF